MKIHLLSIDPQVDFCDPKGALFVGGADKDMDRDCNGDNEDRMIGPVRWIWDKIYSEDNMRDRMLDAKAEER